MNYSLAKKKRVDSDNVAATVLKVVAALSIVAIALILFFIAGNSVDAIFEIGLFEFVFGSEWDPSTGLYGALPVIVGTILVTIGAVAVALPVGLACAVYISEVAKPKYRNMLKTLCEVFAGIPSVIYGFFGLVVMVPLLREIFPDQLAYGLSWFTGSLLLALMALPTIISVSEDAIHAVPVSYREASLGMGASKWETTIKVIIPAAISGISSAAIMGVGRAIGETMAVMMVTGNAAIFPDPLWNIFSMITTITGTLASEMPEIVVGSLHYSALFLLALVLVLMVLTINVLARFVTKRTQRKFGTVQASSGIIDKIVDRLMPLADRISDTSAMGFISVHSREIRIGVVIVLAFVFILMMSSLFTTDLNAIVASAMMVLGFWMLFSEMKGYNRNSVEKVAHSVLAVFMGIVILILFVLLGYIIVNGISAISWDFLTQPVMNGGRDGGIFPAIIGTLELMAGTVLLSLPLGIFTGVYLAEYAKDSAFTRAVREAIDLLNGTPSIVFGLFGFSALVLAAGFGYSMVAGWITLALMILPVIIRTTEEAVNSVPKELREASRGMGATKWQTTVKVVIPAAISGIMTGAVLAVGRAAGETAPIMFTAAVAYSTTLADSIFEPVMALPYHLYYLSTEVPGATEMQYGTACVLLLIVLSLFVLASFIRYRSSKKIRW